jgi:hypothetical protein
MNKRSVHVFLGFLVVWSLMLGACGVPDGTGASAPTAEPFPTPESGETPTVLTPSPTPFPTPSTIPTPTLVPTEAPTPTLVPTETPTESERLFSTAVLLQLDYEPTFFRPETFSPGGRVPQFTLLVDGRVFYIDPGEPPSYTSERLVWAQLQPDAVQALVQQVMDLGFERLESHTDMCGQDEQGQQVCVADAAYSILRVRMPDESLREIKNYHDFANDPAALKAIKKLLTEYRAASAQPYVPEKAALFLGPVDAALEGMEVRDWPLDPALLTPPETGVVQWGVVLEQDGLELLLATATRNMGDAYFRHADQVYGAYLVPWLPGIDYTEEVQNYRREL